MVSDALQITVETTSRKLSVKNTGGLKRGDTAIPVELTFETNSTADRLAEGSAILLGIKKAGSFTGDLLASCDTWTRGASDDDPYTGTLNLNGETLNTLIANSVVLSCIAEVTWPAGSSLFASVSIQNDVNRENDSPPVLSAGFADRVQDAIESSHYTRSQTDTLLTEKADSTSVATALSGKSDVGHTHAELGTNRLLIEWTTAEAYEVTSANYDSDGVITTATVKWPDGSAGTFTTVTKNSTFLTIDAYTITHADSGKTITQAAVTRDGSGNVTAKPALIIS